MIKTETEQNLKIDVRKNSADGGADHTGQTANVVLGIHNGHNASAALVMDGRVVFAAQEERFSRVKNQGGLPARTLKRIDAQYLSDEHRHPVNLPVALAGKNLTRCPWRREEILRSAGQTTSGLIGSAKRLARRNAAISNSLNQMKRNRIQHEIEVGTGWQGVTATGFDHHLCHAAAAYYGWGRMNEKILVLTCDGAGDCLCATVNIGENGALQTIARTDESHSIGALYAKITYLFGMVPMEHEYKLMGLAPYAENSKEAQAVAADLDTIFEFEPRNPMVWRRRNGSPAMQFASAYLSSRLRRKRFDHVAGGVQLFVERFLVEWVRSCVRSTGIRKVALSGGVFMNVKANQKILELPEVDELFIFPSCGDETNAMGAAWLLHRERFGTNPQPIENLYLGTAYSDEAIGEAIGSYPFKSSVRVREEYDVERATAALLRRDEIVARFKGRGEFGARSLGNRSILANASSTAAVRTINEMIKCRDFWMPFAPSVLAERSEDYFLKPKPMNAPFMIITFDSRKEKRAAIPAAIHPYDFTGRPQEVTTDSNPDYYRMLKYYEEMTGEGLVLNTSFNLHGEPVVCSPEDALRVFDISGLQHLAIENYLISKT
jgi:carbamoyltransferase